MGGDVDEFVFAQHDSTMMTSSLDRFVKNGIVLDDVTAAMPHRKQNV
jgi:hypothetical protein